jgi:2-(1,2-epoxy-1,2-dihydrophenyl)acetyl-CoA isomerase
MSTDILTQIAGGVATITFNRPEHRNAVSREMVQELIGLLRALAADKTVRCLVLRGAGAHFSGGGDVKSFNETLELSPEARQALYTQRVAASADLFELLERLPMPVIAVARGAVAGAGLSFVMAADVALASDTTFYVFAHGKIAIALDSGLSYYLPRVVGWRKAKELTLSGARLSPEEALQLGIVSRVVPDAELDAVADKLAANLAASATLAASHSKALLAASLGNDIRTQIELEAVAVGACAASDDFIEGISAFVENRKARFKGG